MTKQEEDVNEVSALENYLKSALKGTFSVDHRTDPSEATVIKRDGCVDLVLTKQGEKFHGTTYAFMAHDVLKQIQEIINESPVKVAQPLGTHMRPDGR